jgi:biopolymer transport protein ExbD
VKIARRPTPAPHIPFIALADIAWQIIIFFLVASTFALNDAMKVDVPASAAAADASQPTSADSLVVHATGSAVLIDGKPIPLDQLQATIAERLKGKTTEQERAVLVMGRDDLTFQQDVEIMYAIQKAGGVLVLSEGSDE